MSALSTWEFLLAALSLVAYASLALHLRQTGMANIYPAFFRYVVAEAILLAAALPLSLLHSRNIYGFYYLASLIGMWPFYVLVCLELFQKALAPYEGIAKLSRWIILGGLAVSMLVSFLNLPMDFVGSSNSFPILHVASALNRAVLGSLAVFVFIVTAFLAWLPVMLPRNARLHTALFFFSFLLLTVVTLYRNQIDSKEAIYHANMVRQSLTIAAVCAWLWKFNPEGERIPASQPLPDGLTSARLLLQMEAFNRNLARNIK